MRGVLVYDNALSPKHLKLDVPDFFSFLLIIHLYLSGVWFGVS